MQLRTALMGAAMTAFITGTATAGGFEPAPQDIDVVPPPVSTASGGSLPGWVIPAVIVAALIGIASSNDDDSDGDANADGSGNS